MRSELLSRLKCWLDAGLGFCNREVCRCCGEERDTAAEGFIGAQCWQNIKFIAPPFCERCGLPFEGAVTTPFECGNCREMGLQFSRARSAVAARGMVLEIIHRYKYQRALWFEPFLADLLVRAAAPTLRQERWDLIVPRPLHRGRKSAREFKQAERLTRHLSMAAQVPMDRRPPRRVPAP